MDIQEKICGGSDKELFEAFKELRQPFIRKLVGEFGCTKEDAQDIYQESFLDLTVQLQKGQKLKVGVFPYLYGIGKNKMRSILRAKKLKLEYDIAEDAFFIDGHEFLSEWKDQIERESKLLYQRIEALGKNCACLLKAFYFDKKSMDEIADEMGYNNGTVVRSTKKRCLQKLRALYKKQKS